MDPQTSPFFWLGSLHKPKRNCDTIANYKLTSLAYPTGSLILPLRNLILAIQKCYINNFPSALMVLGAQVLNVHYEKILPLSRGIPIGMLFGDVQTGKTKILEAALSLLGTQNTHMLKKCSDNNFLKMCSQTTLGVVLDDLTDYKGILEKIMLLFDGKPIETNDERLHPRTSFLASVNMQCFDSLAKHYRLVQYTK